MQCCFQEGFKNEDIQLFSSSETKMHVWRCFQRACEESNKQAVCYIEIIDLCIPTGDTNHLKQLDLFFKQEGYRHHLFNE